MFRRYHNREKDGEDLMFNLFKKDKQDASQPRKDWPWVLTLGAYPGPRSNPS